MTDTENLHMPALFIGHGSPMNAIEETVYSAGWRTVAKSIPKPKAILCISAHWETDGSFVTNALQPRTIHDFFGFPDALFEVQYPAPGAPDIAEQIKTIISSTDIRLDDGTWGLDHGTWSVLRRIYPLADIPTLQLSLDRTRPPRFHYELGRELAPLRREGVLILGSGNIVHNLRRLRWDAVEPYSWAAEFDVQATELIRNREHERLIDYQNLGEAARLSIPSNEHYLPLLYILALQQADEEATFFNEGIPLGSISMRSFKIG